MPSQTIQKNNVLRPTSQLIPFLKWAGGKRWLVCRFSHFFPKTYDTYIEPFLGAGSVYFHLQPPNALLGDVNADLIATYQAIKLDWRSLERSLRYRQRRHRENTEYYYWLRSRSPRELTQRDLPGMNESDRSRGVRKVQMYWAILHKAGFTADETRLRQMNLVATQYTRHFDPHFNRDLRTAAHAAVRAGQPVPGDPSNLDQLVAELEVIARFRRDEPNDPTLLSRDGRPIFDADAVALLEFLNPATGSGPTVIRSYRNYHAPNAGDFQGEILELLDQGRTVILDLGNATDSIRSAAILQRFLEDQQRP